jgi:DNA-binding Xre family transcriptional regulator
MAEKSWYAELIDRLMTEREVSNNGLARMVGLSSVAIYNARKGKRYITVDTLEKILAALSYQLKAEPLPEQKPLPKRDARCVTNEGGGHEKRKVLLGDPESYCYGCGREDTMIKVHNHWQCVKCGYIEPCCND